MPSVTPRDNREMLLGVELTVLGGFLTTWGVVVPSNLLLLPGVPLFLFGFWVALDSYANGADPRSDTGRTGGTEPDPPER